MPATKIVFRVYVTKRRIAEATKGLKHDCAIADALKSVDPDIAWASVDYEFIQFGLDSDERRYKYRTPPNARAFITDFDNGRAPKPFTLELTTEEFVSSTRRQMRQTVTRTHTQARRTVAKATGRNLRQVRMTDVAEYERETGDSVVFPSGKGTAGVAKVGPGVERSRTATTGTPRPYAKRKTLREILNERGEA